VKRSGDDKVLSGTWKGVEIIKKTRAGRTLPGDMENVKVALKGNCLGWEGTQSQATGGAMSILRLVVRVGWERDD